MLSPASTSSAVASPSFSPANLPTPAKAPLSKADVTKPAPGATMLSRAGAARLRRPAPALPKPKILSLALVAFVDKSARVSCKFL